MNYGIIIFVIICIVGAAIAAWSSGSGKLNIKATKVGDGQYGASRWATQKEISKEFKIVYFTPDKWRNGQIPNTLVEGTVLGYIESSSKFSRQARIDTSDSHTMIISAPGGGKTTSVLYPNLEYACACGMSFLATDTKGDVYKNYAGISEKYYSYNPYVIDLSNPTKSHGYNMIRLVNKYTDLYNSTGKLMYKSRAEKYAKITANSIVRTKGFDGGGQNSFFYDAAEGLIASIILLLSECCPDNERHIVSVFKLVQELMEIDPATVVTSEQGVKAPPPKNYYHSLIKLLPDTHKAKWLAGAALNTSQQSMSSVMSTAMSRMLSFIDSELEQIICFDTQVDAEEFCNNKTSVFIVFPENDTPKQFLVSLFIKQFYNECIEIANNNNNRLDKRVMFYEDEYGTMLGINDAEKMFSAGRSRNIIQMPMIQAFSQLNKNYGKDDADTIKDCCTNILFSWLAPLSKTADELSKSLGNETVRSGSVSRSPGKSTYTTNYQMSGKLLLASDEIKTLPKGEWILNKTGMHPMHTQFVDLKKWGIKLDTPYDIEEKAERTVHYASRDTLMEAVKCKYNKIEKSEESDIYADKKVYKTLSSDFL